MKPVSMAIVVALFVFAVIMLAACSDSSTDLSDLSEIASQDRSSGAASFNLSSDQSEQNKNNYCKEPCAMICKDDGFTDCATIQASSYPLDLSKSEGWNDSISSVVLFADTSVVMYLCKNHSYDNSPYGYCLPVKGRYGAVEISKSDLRSEGLHDEISSITWVIGESVAGYIEIFEDDGYKGDRMIIYSTSGGTVNIPRTHDLHDDISSFYLYDTPTYIEVELCQDHIYENANSHCYRWQGTGSKNDGFGINKDRLKEINLHDNVSTIRWYHSGKLVTGSYTLSK